MAKKQANYPVAVAEAEAQAAPEQIPATEQESKMDPIVQVTGDPDVKRMGPAKAGGSWYKNYKSGKLYRIVEKDGKPELAESKKSAVSPNVAKKQTEQRKIAERAAGKAKEPVKGAAKATKEPKGDSRAALMEKAKERKILYFRILNKEELQAVLASKATKVEIEKITEAAKKRWQNCAFFQKKIKKA